MPYYNRDECLDRLRRGYEMEELMNSALIQLCAEAACPADLTPQTWKQVQALLIAIQRDTARHAQTVQTWIQRMEALPRHE